MTAQIPGDLTPQFAAATALAAQHGQPAYVLAAEAGGDGLAMAVLWAELLPTRWSRIVAIILPDGRIFAQAGGGAE